MAFLAEAGMGIENHVRCFKRESELEMPNLLQTPYLLEPSPNVLIIFKGLLASVVFLHGQGKGLERRFGYYMKLSLLHLLL